MSRSEWGYSLENGPDTWATKFPQAAGSRQSPVDIDTSRAAPADADLLSKPLVWRYQPGAAIRLVNTGYGWRVDCRGENNEVSGGPLGSPFTLEQFHCHWGQTSDSGSEHTIDGRAFAGELHLVHWDRSKYASCAEAAAHPDGLAVLGILLKVGRPHLELAKVVRLLTKVVHRNESTAFTEHLDPKQLLPSTPTYWTYLGSLTTPPCSESVTWILFKEPIEVSEEQLAEFRELRAHSHFENACPCGNNELGERISANYRPPLPLGNRVIRECGAGSI